MQQILYNTLMGVADGLALMLVPRLGRQMLGPFRFGWTPWSRWDGVWRLVYPESSLDRVR